MTAAVRAGVGTVAEPDAVRAWRFPPRRRVVISAVALALTAAAMVWSWPQADTPPPAAPPPEPVATEAVVRRQDLHVTLHLSAQTARSEATIAAPAESVLELHVPDGTTVLTGNAIGRVLSAAHDPADAEQAVADAVSMLAAAELDSSKAVGDARRELEVARQAVERLRVRPTDDPATADEVAAADAAHRQARAALDHATAHGALSVAQANDQLARRRDDLAAAEAAATPVIASATGMLRRTSPSTASIDVGLVVRSELLPTQLLRLRSGAATASATVETTGGKRQVPCTELTLSDGSLVASSAMPDDPRSVGGTLECRLSEVLDTVPGLPATIAVSVDFGTDVPVVPEIAIAFDDDGAPYVVTTSGTRVPVELGASDGVLRVVRGIDEGTEVVLQ